MTELWQYTWLLPYAAVGMAAWLWGAWKGYWTGYYNGCSLDRDRAWNDFEAERLRRGGTPRYRRG